MFATLDCVRRAEEDEPDDQDSRQFFGEVERVLDDEAEYHLKEQRGHKAGECDEDRKLLNGDDRLLDASQRVFHT